MAKRLTPAKAREMLRHPPRGRPLTPAQRRTFQAIAHGWRPSMRALRRTAG